MEHEPILQMGSERMLTEICVPQAFHSQVSWQVWMAGQVQIPDRWGSRRGTTVFQAEIYTIRSCVMENVTKVYTGRNMYILSQNPGSHQGPWQLPHKFQFMLGLPSVPAGAHRTYQDQTAVGARTHGNWWKLNNWSVSQRQFLTSTHRTWACTWYICQCCQGGDQGLDEQKTHGALAVHVWTQAG